MNIVKSFVINGTEHLVNMLWKDETLYFRADAIGKILGLKRIYTTLRRIRENEVWDEVLDASRMRIGSNQNTLILSEIGLYRLLTISRKPTAQPLLSWTFNVNTSIRETLKNMPKKDAVDETNLMYRRGICWL